MDKKARDILSTLLLGLFIESTTVPHVVTELCSFVFRGAGSRGQPLCAGQRRLRERCLGYERVFASGVAGSQHMHWAWRPPRVPDALLLAAGARDSLMLRSLSILAQPRSQDNPCRRINSTECYSSSPSQRADALRRSAGGVAGDDAGYGVLRLACRHAAVLPGGRRVDAHVQSPAASMCADAPLCREVPGPH
jgi:hypothetical protein